MSDPATSRWDKNVFFFSVNRQAVACWRLMPSNLNSNYTKLGTFVMKYPGALLTNGRIFCSIPKTESSRLSNVFIDNLYKPLLVSKLNILSLFK